MEPHQKEMLLAALREHGSCRVTVEGTSMWPFVRDGNQIVIRATPTRPALGGVVAFFVGDQLVVHRITGRRRAPCGDWEVTVQGDSMPDSRTKVGWNQIAGVVFEVVRNGKQHGFRFRRPWRVLAIPIAVVLRVLLSIRRRSRHAGCTGRP